MMIKKYPFFQSDFNVDESFIKNENIIMLIDDLKLTFSKSKKLKKGNIKYRFHSRIFLNLAVICLKIVKILQKLMSK